MKVLINKAENSHEFRLLKEADEEVVAVSAHLDIEFVVSPFFCYFIFF